ncbi:hypothetical protein CK203_069293 [Vitis vinifera]|uniref:Uncharacterized protein n=1 Tax=Vitis vinifera TaxID=29760 RepID=A0A438C286_VITVI|nr:hypothetical protein CK203_069293 [Vitis vinifera]
MQLYLLNSNGTQCCQTLQCQKLSGIFTSQTSWKTKALLQVEAGMSWVNVDAAKGKPGGVSVSKAHKGKLHCVNSTTHEQK